MLSYDITCYQQQISGPRSKIPVEIFNKEIQQYPTYLLIIDTHTEINQMKKKKIQVSL